MIEKYWLDMEDFKHCISKITSLQKQIEEEEKKLFALLEKAKQQENSEGNYFIVPNEQNCDDNHEIKSLLNIRAFN